jgi:hypothetical protein
MLSFMRGVRVHHKRVDKELALDEKLPVEHLKPPLIIVPIRPMKQDYAQGIAIRHVTLT